MDKKNSAAPPVMDHEPLEEKRIDEFALEGFGRLGFLPGPDKKNPDLLDSLLVETYNDFKRIMDRARGCGGRLSAEGFAMVISLYELKRELKTWSA